MLDMIMIRLIALASILYFSFTVYNSYKVRKAIEGIESALDEINNKMDD